MTSLSDRTDVAVNFVKAVYKPPQTYQEARAKLNVAIESYTSAIVDLGAAIGIELFLQGKKIEEKIDRLTTKFGEFSLSVETHFSRNIRGYFDSNVRHGRDGEGEGV